MNEAINVLVPLVIGLPLLGAAFLHFFGRRIGEPLAGWLASAAIGTAFVLGLISAFFAAASYVTIRSIRTDPPLLIVFYFSTITVLLGAPVVALGFIEPTLLEAVIVLGVGIATHLGQLAITWAFRLERAGRTSAVGYIQIVFAAGWGWLLFSEVPDAWTWIGAAAITFATLRISRIPPVR